MNISTKETILRQGIAASPAMLNNKNPIDPFLAEVASDYTLLEDSSWAVDFC
jgi:hypothetical protein